MVKHTAHQSPAPLLCLDLEGTLISNAVSQIPRPGLHSFLEAAGQLCDLMIYTSVSMARVETIRNLLVMEGAAPPWFKDLPVIRPLGTEKPKKACGRADAFLLDDQKAVIVPGEEGWWVRIAEFLPPYPENDRALELALKEIKKKCDSR